MYWETALMAADEDLGRRITACVALERVPVPELFVMQRRWEIVAWQDWADAWRYALAVPIPNPGRDVSVITDQMILSSVQAVRGT